jgi:transposase
MEQRAVIRFLIVKGLRASAIAAQLKSFYETETLALSTLNKWRKPFAEGRTSLCDDPRRGRPITNDSEKTGGSAALEQLVKEDVAMN